MQITVKMPQSKNSNGFMRAKDKGPNFTTNPIKYGISDGHFCPG